MRSFRPFRRALHVAALLLAVAPVVGLASQIPAQASNGKAPAPSTGLVPGNLLVATSVFQNDPNIVAGTTQLPPGCGSADAPCGTAVTNGTYPLVFNNDIADGSFGLTSPITLDQITPSGSLVNQIVVPNSTDVSSGADQMVTSFSSKSELALNLSTAGQDVTFMGYNAPVDAVDVSNANTPGDEDSTIADPAGPYYRVVGELGEDGTFHFTETNAFSGDNGRAAILNDEPGAGYFYAAGNAGNGKNPEPPAVVTGAGAQLIQPSGEPESAQTPPTTLSPAGSFNVLQLGDAADKLAKDDNFRGMTISDNVLYYTKGSGGNGVDTVYFVDTTGKACPSGVGLPEPGAPLPTPADVADITDNPNEGGSGDPGLTPENMCILAGFPSALVAAASNPDAIDYPFGMWFANPDTLYVADEGAGDNTNTSFTSTSNGTYSAAQASTTAGLQKWTFDSSTQQWNLAYTLQNGLDLGVPYTVNGYPTGQNPGPNSVPEKATTAAGPLLGETTITSKKLFTSGTDLVNWTVSCTTGGISNATIVSEDAGTNTAVVSQAPTAAVGTGTCTLEAGLPWAPATDGLRNITGHLNANGTATIWAETSTVSGSGDQGADPNELVSVTDNLGATTLPKSESFQTVLGPTNATVIRGVSSTPGTGAAVSGNVTCLGSTFGDTTIQGNVTVPSGSSCSLTDVTVDGNVKVQQGGSLLDTDSTINGNLQANGAAWVDVQGGAIHGNLQVQGTSGTPAAGTASTANDLCGATVDGNVQVQNNGAGAPFDIGAAPDCATPLTVGGNLQVQNNAAAVVIGPAGNGVGNSVAHGNIQVQGNTAGGSLGDNAAGGNCQLQNNTPGIAGSSNTAGGNNSCNRTA
jgi:hypothetical protein